MAGKKIIVNVDIQAQAEQLNKIVQQSKQSLKSLSPQIDKSQFTALENAFNKISKNAATLSTNLKTGLNSPSAFATAEKNVNKLYEDYANTINKIKSLGIDPNKIIPDFAQPTKRELDEMRKQLKTEGSKAGKEFGDNLQKALQQALSKGDVKGVKDLGKRAQAELTKVNRSIISQTANIGKQYGTDAGGATKAIEAEDALMAKLWNSGKQGRAEYEAKGGRVYRDKLQADLEITKQYDSYKAKHTKIGDASAEYQKQAQSVQQLTQKIQQLETELQKMAGPAQQKATQGLNQLAASETRVKTTTDEMRASIDRGNQSLLQQQQRMGQLQQLKSYFGYMFSSVSIVMRLGQAVRGAINDFKELDKQFNEISIVTGKTMNELWGGFKNLNSIAKEYGVTTSNVVSTQKLYYQQGRSAAEVTQLTGETLTLAKISGIEFAEATEYMTAAINAYNIAAGDAARITDTYSALSTEAAVDANEVAVAMSKVASLAAMSGSEFEDTSAYLAKIIETTREAPETAGTALKTVIARFTAVNKLTADQKELLEEDYNFNNIEKALKTVGVAVKDSAGQMRGFTEILNDLGPIWDELDSNTQHYIATQAAGARQQSRFIALMDNWKRTTELVGVAENSAGTGAKQLALAMESIETSINKLKASWQSFYTEFISSGFVKWVIDRLTKILDILTDIAKIDGLGTPLIAGITVAMVLLIKKGIKWGKDFGKAFGKSFKAAYATEREKADKERLAKEAINGQKEGKAHGTSQAAAEEAAERAKHGVDMGQAATDGMAEGTAEGVAHGRAEAIAQRLAKGKAQFRSGFSGTTGKWKSGLKGIFGKKAATTATTATTIVPNTTTTALTTTGTTALTTTGATGAAATGAAGGAAGGSALMATIGAVMPYVLAIALVGLGAWAITKMVEGARVAAEQEILSGVSDSQTKIEEAIKDISSTSDLYLEALDLQRKGLLRNEEEMEKYQETLTSLKETYPSLVRTLADGTLELAANAEEGYSQIINNQRESIKKEYDNINKLLDSNQKAALASGATFSEAGIKIQENIQEITANLTSKSEDYIQDTLGLQGLNTKNLTSLQEKGLNRVSLNEAVNEGAGLFWWGDWDMSQSGYMDMLERISAGEDLSDTFGLNQEYELIAYYAEQMGMSVEDMAKQMIEEADGTATAMIEASNLAATYAAEAGLSVTSYAKAAIEEIARNDKDSGRAEEMARQFYLQNDKDIISQVNKYLDTISSSRKIGEKGTKQGIDFGVVGGNAQQFVDEQIRLQEKALNELLIGENGLAETYRTAVGQFTSMTNDEVVKKFSNLSVEELSHLISQVKKVSVSGGFEAAKAFEQSYLNYMDSISYSEELVGKFGQVDMTNIQQTTNYAAEMAVMFGKDSLEYQNFVRVVNNSSNILDRTFRNTVDILSDTKTKIEDMSNSIKSLGEAISGDLSPEGLLDLLKEYGDFLDPSMFKATSEGLKIVDTESLDKAKTLQDQILQIQKLQWQYEVWMNQLRMDALKAEINNRGKVSSAEVQEFIALTNKWKEARDTMTQDEKNKWNELKKDISDSGEYTNVATIMEAESANKLLQELDVVLEQIYIDAMKANSEQAKLVKQLEKLVELLDKIEEYADIDAYMQNLEAELEHYEFELEFSTNVDNLVNTTKDKIDTINNLLNASISKSQRAEQNAASHRKILEENFGKAVSFDENGNLLTNDEWIRNEMDRISKITNEDEQEAQEKILETLYKRIDAYREEFNTAKQSRNEAEKYLKQIEETNRELRENVVALEDKFRDLFIKRDEEALESLKERYDAIKKMDEDYLDSVREAVEKERQLRDRSNEAEDLEKMEKQLELMRMSGGSATEIQALEEEIAQKRQDMADQRQDDAIEEMELENQRRAEDMDKEIEFQTKTLEEKKKNQILYNQEIAALMQQDKETIMNTWKQLDIEFQISTSNNKKLLEDAMDKMVAKGLSSKTLLSGDYIPAIEQSYKNVAKAINIDRTTMEDFSKDVGKYAGNSVKSISLLKTEYYNLSDSIEYAWKQQLKLNSARNALNNMSIDLPEDDEIKFDGGPESKYTVELEKNKTYKVNGKHFGYSPTTKNWYDLSQGRYGASYNPTTGGLSSILTTTNPAKTVIDAKTIDLLNTIANLETGTDFNLSKGDGRTYENLKNVDFSLYYTAEKAAKYPTGGHGNQDAVWNPTEMYNPQNGTTWKVVNYDLSYDEPVLELEISTPDMYNPNKKNTRYFWVPFTDFTNIFNIEGSKYAEGGMVDYTGPAWVDGTKSKPEAFLSANDTQLIASLRDVLNANPKFGSMAATTIQKTGDTYYEIHINVDELGDGYSVDDLMNELEERIVQVTDKNTVIKVG